MFSSQTLAFKKNQGINFQTNIKNCVILSVFLKSFKANILEKASALHNNLSESSSSQWIKRNVK